jgi:hypothetical protein
VNKALGMMSHVTCTDLLQSIMTHPAFQFTVGSSTVKLYFLPGSSLMVLSSAKLISIFAKFKIAASSTYNKGQNILKHSCSTLKVSHSASSKKDLRPMLDYMIDKVPSIHKGQRICDKCHETTANLPKSFGNGNETIVSSSSGHVMEKKRKTWTVLKLSRPTLSLP